MITWNSNLKLIDKDSRGLNYGRAVYLLDLFIEEHTDDWMVTRFANKADAKAIGNKVRQLILTQGLGFELSTRGDTVWIKNGCLTH